MDISVLARAVRTHMAPDAWKPRFTGDDWTLLARHLERRVLSPGQVLVGAGDVDRTVYLVEAGSLQVILSQAGTGAGQGIAHLMTLIDVVAGFSISIFSVRRDYSIGRNE